MAHDLRDRPQHRGRGTALRQTVPHTHPLASHRAALSAPFWGMPRPPPPHLLKALGAIARMHTQAQRETGLGSGLHDQRYRSVCERETQSVPRWCGH